MPKGDFTVDGLSTRSDISLEANGIRGDCFEGGLEKEKLTKSLTKEK